MDDAKFLSFELIIWWWHFGCIHKWTPESRIFGWLAKIKSMQLEQFSQKCACSDINCFIFNPCLNHYQGGSFTQTALITAYYSDIPPKGHWESCNEVESLNSSECPMVYEPRIFWLMYTTLTTRLLSIIPNIKRESSSAPSVVAVS